MSTYIVSLMQKTSNDTFMSDKKPELSAAMKSKRQIKMKAGKILVGLLVAIGVVAFLSVIIVKEVNQAIILQFGDPKRIIMKPGLNFKIPFIQNVVYLDKRILNLSLIHISEPTRPY